jgi:hypothetical protein
METKSLINSQPLPDAAGEQLGKQELWPPSWRVSEMEMEREAALLFTFIDKHVGPPARALFSIC